MSAVKIADLEIGQKFESDIKFDSGTVLFKADEKISFKHIKALKAWGFTEVGVVETQNETKVKEIKNNAFSSDSTTEHIFSKSNNEDPVIIELKRISQNLKDSQ